MCIYKYIHIHVYYLLVVKHTGIVHILYLTLTHCSKVVILAYTYTQANVYISQLQSIQRMIKRNK